MTFSRFSALLRAHWLPLAAVATLGVFNLLTPDQDLTPEVRTPIEQFAHNLGHGINSLWVGIGLILLVVPSLYANFAKKRPDMWAWRALDALLLDFLLVDVLGKDVFMAFHRPGNENRPGFPSGHATMAFLLASLIWRRYPKLGPLWFLMAALIAWSRVMVHAHYPYQVMAGALYGVVFGALIAHRPGGVLAPRLFISNRALSELLQREFEAEKASEDEKSSVSDESAVLQR